LVDLVSFFLSGISFGDFLDNEADFSSLENEKLRGGILRVFFFLELVRGNS